MSVTIPKRTDALSDLRQCRLFRSLADEDLASLANSVDLTLKKGCALTWGGDVEASIFVVMRGMVKLAAGLNASHRETILALLGPGELFGSLPHLNLEDDTCRAVAMEETVLARIDASAMQSLMTENPDWATRIARMIGRRLKRIEARMSNLLFRDARQRVAFILLDLSRQWGARHWNGTLLNLRVTHQDIANLTGLTRETVSVTLADFDLGEMIATEGRRIIVRDPDRLLEIVQKP